ncbi:methylmalonyl-CoA epimerase [Oceanobacillus kapialis]|uniref:methylmalonyl-CoA epimerase n=1 Tax=Oceanobacillus kapialis TaxID=481353 RepID=UPI00384EEBE4
MDHLQSLKESMTRNAPKLAHIGIAVRNIESVLPFYVEVLGLQLTKTEKVATEGVKAAILQADNTQIELLEPLSATSPIHCYIEKYGEGLHHIAFETDDIAKKVKDIHSLGVPLVSSNLRKGVQESKIAFIHPKASYGSLIEYCEYVGRKSNE